MLLFALQNRAITNFYIKYVSQATIGEIAYAHSANSDLYGIDSEICNRIAIKCSQAVDYSSNNYYSNRLTL